MRYGRTSLPRLTVPGEIFACYQPLIGGFATLVWLNLRFAAQAGEGFSPQDLAQSGMEAGPRQFHAALEKLRSYELVDVAENGDWIVHDPLPQWAFAERFGAVAASDAKAQDSAAQKLENPVEVAAAAPASDGGSPGQPPAKDGPRDRAAAKDEKLSLGATKTQEKPVMRSPLSRRRASSGMLKLVEPPGEEETPENPDMQAVMQIYHKKIGMIGPTQYEKLRFWVEEQGMEGAVVALAIEETVRSAEVPRISYLEGILRNWYNDGIRSLADLHEHKRASRVLSGEGSSGRQGRKTLEGTPNASAYTSVSAELIAKWKELYPDEYDG